MSDQSVPEPGWQEPSRTEEELYPSTEGTSPRQSPSSTRSSESSPPSPDSAPGQRLKIPFENLSSSQGSSDALAGLLAEGLQLVSAAITLLAKRRGLPDLKMQPGEARSAAQPIARLIARRVQIRRDLNEATDATAAGASLMSYVERIVTGAIVPPRVDRLVAQAPPAASSTLADERYAPPPQAPRPAQAPAPAAPAPSFAAPQAAVHDQGGDAVPGSGPFKGAFLEGFDE